MFDNPIIFSLLISSIIALGFYIYNRENDKKNYDLNKNMKYVLVFGIVFIICLIGKICFNDTLNKVEEDDTITLDNFMDDMSDMLKDKDVEVKNEKGEYTLFDDANDIG